jgi:hypothetical protein
MTFLDIVRKNVDDTIIHDPLRMHITNLTEPNITQPNFTFTCVICVYAFDKLIISAMISIKFGMDWMPLLIYPNA